MDVRCNMGLNLKREKNVSYMVFPQIYVISFRRKLHYANVKSRETWTQSYGGYPGYRSCLGISLKKKHATDFLFVQSIHIQVDYVLTLARMSFYLLT